MEITEFTATKGNAAHECPSEIGFVQSLRLENLNVETVPSNMLLPADGKWAIRFNAGATVTIVLGMRDYWRGWLSAYFANLVATRLGIPFGRIRVYYSAALPAVLQPPCNPLMRETEAISALLPARSPISLTECATS